jgi:glycoprotein endo-alpha-1,2-mannosidase
MVRVLQQISTLGVATLLASLSLWPGLMPVGRALASNPARPVLAYYYAWWDPPNFDRTRFQPEQAYNSDDPAIMQQHVAEAQSAGIDGFVMSWYGVGDRTDTNLGQLMQIAARTDFRVTIHFETGHFSGVDQVVAQLAAFYATRLNHPAMVRYQDRPVIFFWQSGRYDNATWSWIRGQVDPNRDAVWIADGDQFGIMSGDAWDGISPYAIAWSPNPRSQLVSWAGKAAAVAPDKLYIPPVSPGCDDSAARPPTCLRDRGDGAYYQAAWDGALAANPHWAIMVNTFNEWMESTQIEPSVEYGDEYLRLTRQNADLFHAGGS